MKQEALTRWTCDQAAELYGIRNWGSGYFDISPDGDVVVRPRGKDGDISVRILDLIKELRDRNLDMPVMIRFADILASQLDYLYHSFESGIREANYRGIYRGVFPIKVNQQCDVVTDIVRLGRKYNHGLEAGSKAEFFVAASLLDDPEALLICNGYKDEEYIDLALRSLKIGLNVVLVIEMPSELPLIMERARRLKVRPNLGVRAKLASRSGGHWDDSGGDRGKFGMDSTQICTLIDRLREHNMLDCLQLLHYHLGSQIVDIRRVRNAVREASRIYVGLVREGAAMGKINVGGGLAVDYDGSHTNFASSRNYSTPEYAADVVEGIMNVCDDAGIEHPMIVSESGRATVSHHGVLVFNILHTRKFEPPGIPSELPEDCNEMVVNLMECSKGLTPRNVQEMYHDAVYYRDEIRVRFLHGDASLRERSLAETIFWHVIYRIWNIIKNQKYIPDEMEGLGTALADLYYGNFSVFQSMPDAWAIDQLFPVMPIHRHKERPKQQAVLADITCDSDGKLDTFIDLHDVKHTLPLHTLNDDEYYLGAFLVGAYQEAIGDMHNLLGNTNVLHVRLDENGQVEFANEIAGDSVTEVLSYAEYNCRDMMRRIRSMAESAVKEGRISGKEKGRTLKTFEAGLRGYTYFER